MSFEARPPRQDKSEVRLHLGGLLAGTQVLTADGMIPVERLAAGDRLVTRDQGLQPLRLITQRVPASDQVIEVHPNAFGLDACGPALVVSPRQRLFLRDWRARAMYGRSRALVAARRLVDGENIVVRNQPKARFFSLHLDALRILYANGFEVGSATPVTRLLDD